MTITKDSAGCSNATVCYAAMPMERLRYLAGMICMVEARQEHARRKQMQSEQKSPSLLSVYEWIDYWQEGSDQHLVDQFDMQRDGKKRTRMGG